MVHLYDVAGPGLGWGVLVAVGVGVGAGVLVGVVEAEGLAVGVAVEEGRTFTMLMVLITEGAELYRVEPALDALMAHCPIFITCIAPLTTVQMVRVWLVNVTLPAGADAKSA